jgi:hypothetical protein
MLLLIVRDNDIINVNNPHIICEQLLIFQEELHYFKKYCQKEQDLLTGWKSSTLRLFYEIRKIELQS